MKVELVKLPSIMAGYLERYVLPKAVLKSEKAAIGAMIFIIAKKGTEMVNSSQLVGKLKAWDVIDEDGYLDLDLLKEFMTYTLKAADNSFDLRYTIPIIGTELAYKFDTADLDVIMQLAQSVAE